MSDASSPAPVEGSSWRARVERGGHSGFCDGPSCSVRLDEIGPRFAIPADDAWFCGTACAEEWEHIWRTGGS